jgi:hypothetical protein
VFGDFLIERNAILLVVPVFGRHGGEEALIRMMPAAVTKVRHAREDREVVAEFFEQLQVTR